MTILLFYDKIIPEAELVKVKHKGDFKMPINRNYEIRKLAEAIKRLRIKEKMTQTEVAERIGSSLQSYFRHEAGMSEPKAITLMRLGKLYNINPCNLLDEEYLKYLEEKSTKIIPKMQKLGFDCSLDKTKKNVIIKDDEIGTYIIPADFLFDVFEEQERKSNSFLKKLMWYNILIYTNCEKTKK